MMSCTVIGDIRPIREKLEELHPFFSKKDIVDITKYILVTQYDLLLDDYDARVEGSNFIVSAVEYLKRMRIRYIPYPHGMKEVESVTIIDQKLIIKGYGYV